MAKIKSEFDHQFTHEITCPHCGYEIIDSWEYEDYEEEIECGECEGKYSMNRNTTVDYCTQKIES